MAPDLDIDNLEFSSPTVKDNERFDSPKARGNFTIGFCIRKVGTKDYRPCANQKKEGDDGCGGCIRFCNYVAGSQ